MSTNRQPKGKVERDTDVRRSDRGGYIYGETGRQGRRKVGVVPLLPSGEVGDILSDMPDGTFAGELLGDGQLILYVSNTTTSGTRELIPIGGGLVSGQSELGLPTDGDFSDGAVNINPSGTIADAIDAINEYLLGCDCASLASHLGTQDGDTDGRLVSPNYIIARVASPDLVGNPFFTNSWDNDTDRDVTNLSSFTWQLIPGEEITDLQGGVIEARFYNGNNVLVHTETLIPDGTVNDQVSTPSGYIEINNLAEFIGFVQGRIQLDINALGILSGDSGYVRVELDHTINSTTYSETTEFFRDSLGGPTITTQSIAYVGGPVKYLSGVAYATISGASNPQFLLSADASGIWSDTYRVDPLRVLAQNIGIPTYTVQYNATTVTKEGVSPPVAPFEHDHDFQYSETREATLPGILNPDQNGNFTSINYEVRDPFNTSLGSAVPVQVLINTQASQSTDVLELFVDEDYRLTPNSGTTALTSISGAGRGGLLWDSTSSLAILSGLQVINHSLIYPQSDFSVYSPAANPDYTSLPGTLGDEVYVRRFRDTLGTARSNGIILIEGLSEADRAAGNILIDLRVIGPHINGNGTPGPGNTGTGWLSLNTNYNSGLFTGDDGDGIFVTTTSQVAPYFEFTLGGFSTAFSANNAIEMRITYKNPVALSKRIMRVEFVNWNG